MQHGGSFGTGRVGADFKAPTMQHSHFYSPRQKGSVEVICGPMFSGKSTEIMRRLSLARIAKRYVQAFKPALDDRYAVDDMVTHTKAVYPASAVQKAADILVKMKTDTQVVGIDEAQFFDGELPKVVDTLAERGLRVVVAGLDQDYLGQPFGTMPQLLAMAEHVTKLTAICMTCGEPASRSFKLHGSADQVEVGAKQYEARCREHARYES